MVEEAVGMIAQGLENDLRGCLVGYRDHSYDDDNTYVFHSDVPFEYGSTNIDAITAELRVWYSEAVGADEEYELDILWVTGRGVRNGFRFYTVVEEEVEVTEVRKVKKLV